MGSASYALGSTTVAVLSGMDGTAVPEKRTSMRLIDADMADVVIIYDKGNELTQVSAIREYIERQREFLDKFPTINAVPVVRCWECVHYEMDVCLKIYDDGAASRYAWQERKPDDFCSYGERKEGVI